MNMLKAKDWNFNTLNKWEKIWYLAKNNNDIINVQFLFYFVLLFNRCIIKNIPNTTSNIVMYFKNYKSILKLSKWIEEYVQ